MKNNFLSKILLVGALLFTSCDTKDDASCKSGEGCVDNSSVVGETSYGSHSDKDKESITSSPSVSYVGGTTAPQSSDSSSSSSISESSSATEGEQIEDPQATSTDSSTALNETSSIIQTRSGSSTNFPLSPDQSDWALGILPQTTNGYCDVSGGTAATSCCNQKSGEYSGGKCTKFPVAQAAENWMTDSYGTSTLWCSRKALVGTTNQDIVTFDLKAFRPIERILVTHPSNYPYVCGAATNYKIEVSKDKINWSVVAAVTGDTKNIKEIKLPQVAFARYVRLNVSKVVDGSGWRLGISDFKVIGPSKKLERGDFPH